MAANPERQIKKQAEYHLKRIGDPSIKRIFDKNSADLVEFISKASRQPAMETFLLIALRFNGLASWYSSVGLAAIYQGNPAGWTDVHRSCRYLVLSTHIQLERSRRVWEATRATGKAPVAHYMMYSLSMNNTISHNLAYCCVNGILNPGDFIGNHLVATLVDSGFPKTSALGYFIASLYCREKGREFHPPDDKLKIYQTVIDKLNKHEDISEDIIPLCDYHCERMLSKSNDLVDFQLGPCDLVPYEIMFLRRVGAAAMPGAKSLSHPLLESVFAKPLPSEYRGDPAYDQVVALFGRFLSA